MPAEHDSYYQTVSRAEALVKDFRDSLPKKGSNPREYFTQVLGLSDAQARDPKAVKKAWHKMMKQFHPDKFEDLRTRNPGLYAQIVKANSEINAAYSWLSSPQKQTTDSFSYARAGSASGKRTVTFEELYEMRRRGEISDQEFIDILLRSSASVHYDNSSFGSSSSPFSSSYPSFSSSRGISGQERPPTLLEQGCGCLIVLGMCGGCYWGVQYFLNEVLPNLLNR